MERSRRVYPSQRSKDGWLSGLMLFLSAVVVLSGLVFRGEENTLLIERAATPTPIPLEEKFDETPAQKELDLPEATWYALQLGAFEQKEAAQQLAQKYRRRGAGGYLRHGTAAGRIVPSLAERSQAQPGGIPAGKRHKLARGCHQPHFR